MSAKHKYPLSSSARPLSYIGGGAALVLSAAFALTPWGAELFISWFEGTRILWLQALQGPEGVKKYALYVFIAGVIGIAWGGFKHRQRSSIYETDDIGIRKRDSEDQRLKWSDIEEVSLKEHLLKTDFTMKRTETLYSDLITPGVLHRYYPRGHPFFPKRFDSHWLRLEIKGRSAKVTVESPLSGFNDILARIAGLTAEGRVQADSDTRKNFETLGYPLH